MISFDQIPCHLKICKFIWETCQFTQGIFMNINKSFKWNFFSNRTGSTRYEDETTHYIPKKWFTAPPLHRPPSFIGKKGCSKGGL